MSYKVGMVSLGCDKNRVDAEIMLAALAQNGFEIVNDEREADVIIINTCGFIEAAKEESIEVILEMAQFKKSGRLKAIIASGCMAQRYSDELIKEIPEIDGIVGVGSYKEISDIINEIINKNNKIIRLGEIDYRLEYEKRILTTPSHFAYVKIAEGCSNNCSYCIIPKLRGKYRSKNIDDILKEVKELALQGVKEIILVAQDTSMYGVDIYKKKMLSELLKRIEDVEGIEWIRVMYSYPEEISDELIKTVKDSKKILSYFDIPLQHINNDILKSMRRRITKEEIIKLIEKIRFEIPDAIIRTTLIVGYPGETEKEFNELKDFLTQYRLDRVGIFTYSSEEDTPAALLPNQVDDSIKVERRDILMKLQAGISLINNKGLIGKIIDVIIDGRRNKSTYYGRTYGDSPDIDQQIIVNSKKDNLNTGDILKVKISKGYMYDLLGDVYYESSK